MRCHGLLSAADAHRLIHCLPPCGLKNRGKKKCQHTTYRSRPIEWRTANKKPAATCYTSILAPLLQVTSPVLYLLYFCRCFIESRGHHCSVPQSKRSILTPILQDLPCTLRQIHHRVMCFNQSPELERWLRWLIGLVPLEDDVRSHVDPWEFWVLKLI